MQVHRRKAAVGWYWEIDFPRSPPPLPPACSTTSFLFNTRCNYFTVSGERWRLGRVNVSVSTSVCECVCEQEGLKGWGFNVGGCVGVHIQVFALEEVVAAAAAVVG